VNATITVKVVFSPVFRAVFHCPECDVVLPKTDTRISGLLFQLSKASAGKIDTLVFETGRDLISTALMVQVNDRVYTGNMLNREMVVLEDRDVVSLLYYVSGG
jgi:hypothetical protein